MHPRLAALLVAGLLVSGCGGANPEPAPLPSTSPSPSASPSASPTATPPVLPDAAKAKTKEGAITLRRSFLDALNFAGASRQTAAPS